MKVVGLITEYNPFHNGHAYHLNEAKRATGADYVVVVMSGNFVQRGTPAFLDKYSRTKMALKCGADLVFELPVCFSTASAEYFALGAVSLLEKLGIVDYICFGSESGDISLLTSISDLLLTESHGFKQIFKEAVKAGKTFPEARADSIKALLPEVSDEFLSSPNNILGIEYIKALKRLQSTIKPITITRKATAYHSQELDTDDTFAISSATAIRKTLKEGNTLNNLRRHVPAPAFAIMEEQFEKTFPIFEEDFSLLLHYKFMLEDRQTLLQYTDINSDLANRILRMYSEYESFPDLALSIKSRQWTLTRINRALIHILLNHRQDNFLTYQQKGFTQYARILGFKKESSHLLRKIVKNERIPVITKLGDAKNKLSKIGLTMLNEDLYAANLYNQVVFHKLGTPLKDEYTKGIIIS
ncbi:nucleotidyltransferase [Anaerocolumna cellulosilytica]|nr:nucleotidyltransferase [Anaerocolumna cellulosilytica]MBB5197442.1 putative nucleotidyltransferase [Anaerocolumna cellulosilytica]